LGGRQAESRGANILGGDLRSGMADRAIGADHDGRRLGLEVIVHDHRRCARERARSDRRIHAHKHPRSILFARLTFGKMGTKAPRGAFVPIFTFVKEGNLARGR